MIEPGDKFTIEHGGETFAAGCLTRSQQRKIIGVLTQLQNIEESVESIAKVYDLADELLQLCVPSMPMERRELMSNQDAFEIAAKVLVAHTMGTEAKKKSGSPHSSEQDTSAKVAVPDVLVVTGY